MRRKFIVYLLFIHLSFVLFATYFLWDHRVWLLAVEAFLLLSFFLAKRLFRALFTPLELLMTGTEFIKESDFSAELREAGQPEMDQLIRIYNNMIRRLREERLRLQEQNYFLDKVLTASPSGIITFDFDERITMANPSAVNLLQSSLPEMIGNKLSEFKTPFADALDRLSIGESQVIPFRGQRRLKCQKSQFIERGFPRAFILMEELTEELRRSEKAAYEKLIRTMSHEINNSIGAVNSLLHSCLTYKDQLGATDRLDFENALQVAILRTENLNAFMKSFADVVRLPRPTMQSCHVVRMLEEIAMLLSRDSDQRRIAWEWDINDPLDSIMMDKHQMEQVFLNILKNAMEAIGENGTIAVRTGKKVGRGFVVIEDSGSGLTPEVKANLFTPFFTTKENGQGVGLTMVQEILSRHQFEFSLEGQPGQPTRFSIAFR
jgi:nitrogen fixation/metabolism regulation signal transduction histidine kinase